MAKGIVVNPSFTHPDHKGFKFEITVPQLNIDGEVFTAEEIAADKELADKLVKANTGVRGFEEGGPLTKKVDENYKPETPFADLSTADKLASLGKMNLAALQAAATSIDVEFDAADTKKILADKITAALTAE